MSQGSILQIISSVGTEKDMLDIALDSNDSELKVLIKSANILRDNVKTFEKFKQFEVATSFPLQ